MRIYVAKNGDSLLKISETHKIELNKLLIFNPHISSPMMNITGYKVYLPSPPTPDTLETPIAECPLPSPSDLLSSWIPLTSLEQMAETDYDVLIIGSGAGGGAVLRRLAEQWRNSEKKVGMIEAGSLLLPTHVRNIPTINDTRFSQYFHTISKWTGKYLPDFPGARQLFALGGRTLFWGMSAPRMDDSEFSDWPIPLKEMKYYYNIAEKVMRVSTAYMEGSSIQEILLKRLHENGFPEARDVPTPADLEVTKYGQIHSDVFWSSISALAYALNRMPFDLAVNARAVKVMVEQNQVVGVKVMSPTKRTYVLKAQTIVLSGSTFETPRLLLHSGIKGRAVGHYLTNHSFLLATAKVSRQEFPEVLGTLSIFIPQTKKRLYQIQMGGPGGDDQWYLWYPQYEEKPLLDEILIGISAFGKVESRFENYVTLDPYKQDAYGVPKINVNFSYSQQDTEIIHQMADALNQVSSAMKAPLIVPNSQQAICLMPPGSDYHEVGTCRMGDDPHTSVTNRYGQVHGVAGLYVADNSVFPSMGAANPTLTTVALSIRTADYIVNQQK
ncbi:GMC family oxidoreductase [Halalkalibacter lacteus]|uniref:GMC family oxidoreductase n=1 Tax=Halalkalibacter lacteus TaxID=3090663 RepID=UPI002FC7BB6F